MKIKPVRLLTIAALAIAPILFTSCAERGGAPPAANPAAEAAQMPWSGPTSPEGGGLLGRVARSNTESYSAKPKTRPGLGTGWGNSVSSRIGYSHFMRASSKPTTVTSIFYNDKDGVRAMAGTWRYTGSGMQKAANGLVEWGVKGTWGSLKNYHAKGRRYVVGRKGMNYSLVVKNLCHSRLEIVLSVDGLDVMDGKPASTRKRGYIVEPGKTLTVKGFRTSERTVAAFKFSSVSNSYSGQRHGTTRNVGVIGMAVFTQKGVDPWKWSRPAVQKRHSATPFAEAPTYRAR